MASDANRPEHGGDPARAAAAAGIVPGAWLDLSTGINPLPYPHEGISAEAFARLPDAAMTASACETAARCYGVADPGLIVPVPGTQAALQWLPRLRPHSRVAVLGPTYAEHAHTWRAAGHDVTDHDTISGALAAADVVVVVNPNNPNGRRLAPGDLVAAASELARRGGWLVVDEAFADVAPEISVAGQIGIEGLVVLRSFGKFFGLAGLRLGFVLGWPGLVGTLRDALGPWAVSGPALAIAAQALSDIAWIAATRDRLRRDAVRLDSLLGGAGLRVDGGTDLFRLALSPQAPACYDRLLRSGIAVRRFSERPEQLRFGLPGVEADWKRLMDALAGTAPHPS